MTLTVMKQFLPCLLLDCGDGRVLEQAGWGSVPALDQDHRHRRDIHEAGYFGHIGSWVNTAFALLPLLALSAALLWLLERLWSRSGSRSPTGNISRRSFE